MNHGHTSLLKCENFMKVKQQHKAGYIYIAEPYEISIEGIKLLIKHGYQTIYDRDESNENQIIGIFIRTYTKITKEYLDKFKNLKFILRAGVGLDNIDLDECRSRAIKVFHAPGANKESVAEYILAMTLYMIRNIAPQIDRVSNNQWRDLLLVGTGLSGKTIGLIGCGNVGLELVRKMEPFNVSFLGYDPYISAEVLSASHIVKTNLLSLLSDSDVVVVVLPLTQETKGIINKEAISQMKRTAILINVSRGEIIDESSLIQALKSSKISGAVLDVIQGEPIVNPIFHDVPNLIITPHIAGLTTEANIQISVAAVTNFIKAQNI